VAVKLDEQVDRLIDLIRSLLDTTRLSHAELSLFTENFSMNELIAETIEDLKHVANGHELKQVSEEDIFITADKKRIREVVVNLISNAIKYSPKGGGIIVSLKKTKEGVQVSVQDKGIGISEDVKSKIFDRF